MNSSEHCRSTAKRGRLLSCGSGTISSRQASSSKKVSFAPSTQDQNSTSSSSSKKTYGKFLIYRHLKRDQKNGIDYLIGCLHNRIRFSMDLDNENQGNSKNSSSIGRQDLQQALQAFICPSSNSLKRKRSTSKSFCDTLLELINGFDAAGVAEIFRLLLERRSAIPLFLPSSKQHHLPLLRHITFGDNILLGEDTSLMRAVIISCRQPEESETCGILKSLFHVQSIHTEDFKRGSLTSNDLTAEIGIGCILTENSGQQEIQNLLVIHVVGDFKPFWPFLLEFVDYLLIEDATNEEKNFYSLMEKNNANHSVISKADLASVEHICLWKPTVGEPRLYKRAASRNEFKHYYIEGHLGERMVQALTLTVNIALQEELKNSEAANERIKLYLIPILEGSFTPIACPSPAKIKSSLAEIPTTLKQIKKNEFVLQKIFCKQAKYEEAVCDRVKVKENDNEIKKCILKRKRVASKVKDHPLLSLFRQLLSIDDPSSRVLSMRMFEKLLVDRRQREQLLEDHDDQHNDGDDSETSEIFSIEHIWRELSHLHSALLSYRNRSPEILKIPRLAAQHLIDGFSLELLDGDSNLIHMEWMKCVFQELGILIGSRKRERIFVLSVMGVQSSGKSTLLNTMFGIQMRTSVGRCTRGINMQLLAVEGRPEYDYILLLDTEGTRAPEYHGLPGNEKRDNQMATWSILLADATIIVIPGENDAAIKEILPVVKLAYQGSKLAEENGGQLSSMMFFVYNRIDTTQKDKLNNIVKILETSLNEAFNLVQNLGGNVEVPFRGFKLDTSNSSESDVCILGNVKRNFEPPGDVPNSNFGEALVQLREHIHRRVTTSGDGSPWNGRSIEEFSKYVEDVGKCIGSANFTLSFASVMERNHFDKMDREYKVVEQKLAEKYRKVFESMEKKMVEEKGESCSSSNNQEGDEESLLKSFEVLLRDDMLPTELALDKEVDLIIKVKNREKWSLQFQELWRFFKIEQSQNWISTLKISFSMLFYYEHHFERYQKKIRQEIGVFFKKAPRNTSRWKDSLKRKKFNEIYDNILAEVKEKFPSKNVPELIAKVYENSNAIKERQIDFKVEVVDPDYDRVDEDPPADSSSNKNRTKENEANFGNCSASIKRVVTKNVAGKICYDDSIISKVIREVDDAIKSHHITANSNVQKWHILGRQLITGSMKKIQDEWETNNSVYAKLQQEENRELMFEYFMASSIRVEKTKLFATTIANELKKSLSTAFEKEMIRRTSNRIRNERWLHDARFMHKHMDLHLVGLLEKNKAMKIILEFMFDPKSLYQEVLKQLIAKKVPNIAEESMTFANYVKGAIQEATIDSTYDDKDRAHQFVCSLRNIFLNCGLQSDYLSRAFMMDVRGEFEDCDKEEKKNFLETCLIKLNKVIEDYKPPKVQNIFAKKISPKVIDYLILLNDAAALPRCDACCPLCKSMCIEAANHDTKQRPHDAVHQPAGISGVHGIEDSELISTTCSQQYANDDTFECDVTLKTFSYKEFSKVYPDWKDPLINEELPLREFIFYAHNEVLASWHGKLPCSDIPSHYNRDLPTIRAQLKRDLNL